MKNRKTRSIATSPFVIYILISILVSLIDTSIVWFLYRSVRINLVTANTVGVIAGSAIHYLLSSKSVFQTKLGLKGLIIYFGTFLFGLVIADWLVYLGNQYFFKEFDENMNFFLSKGISIFGPFLIVYFIRRILFHKLSSKRIVSDGQQS